MPGQLLQAHVARDFTHAAEHAEDAALQRLLCRAAWQQLQLPLPVLRNQALALRVAIVDLRNRVSLRQHGLLPSPNSPAAPSR